MNKYANPHTERTPESHNETSHNQRPEERHRESSRKPRKREEDDDKNIIRNTIGFFRSRKTQAILGIALILLAAYLSVAALSFLRSNPADQSRVVSESVDELSAHPGVVDNIAGPVGAKVSHHLFVEGLGLGSIVLIVYMVIIGLALLRVRKTSFWSLTFKSLIFAVTISMVIGLITLGSGAPLPPGGYHGRYINLLLISHAGWIGAVIVNCLLVAILCTIYIAQLTAFYKKYKIKIRTLRDKQLSEKDHEEYVREQVGEALSEGPINEVAAEDKTPTPDTETQPTVVSSFAMPRQVDSFSDIESEAVTDNESETESLTVNPKPEPETHTDDEPRDIAHENSDSDDSDSSANNETADPGFTVKEATEIERGSGEIPAEKSQGPYDPRADLSRYKFPPLSLLRERPRKAGCVDLTEQEENKERITKTLYEYGIQIVKIEATVGPTVTLYEIIPAEGVRIAKIKSLENDIAMNLAAIGIRIIAPIPGKGTIGIEVPNKDPQTVSIHSILGSRAFQECRYELPMALGATIANEVYIADLAKMPHLLVAGATGQGKSVGLNTIIASMLYKRHPSELKFVLIDPKMVEFSLYARLEKHYLAKLPSEEEPIVTNPQKGIEILNSLCLEMDNRFELLKDAGVRNVIEYNQKFMQRRLNPEKGHRYMPYIVTIVDEFADLIMMAGKAVEMPVARIAQKGRAAGMHLIIATQRPSTNVITGMIKANFPGRIGFRVQQMVDSRTILDCPGANQLIGKGDMIISRDGQMERVQCAFIDTDEVDAICRHIDEQIGYPHAYILPDPPAENNSEGNVASLSERDSLFEEIARLVVQGTTASTSNIQRKYSIGYNRAGKIMDQLEAAGIVGPAQGGKPRQVLVDPTQLEMILESL